MVVDLEIRPDVPAAWKRHVTGVGRFLIFPGFDTVLEKGKNTIRLALGDFGEKGCDLVGVNGWAFEYLAQNLICLVFRQVSPREYTIWPERCGHGFCDVGRVREIH